MRQREEKTKGQRKYKKETTKIINKRTKSVCNSLLVGCLGGVGRVVLAFLTLGSPQAGLE